MEQQDLFDASLSRKLRNEGIKRNEIGSEEWKSAALTAFIQFGNALMARRQADLFDELPPHAHFITEDFRQWWMNRANYREPRHHNAWGAFTAALMKAGLIRPTGFVRAAASIKSHARKMLEWEIISARPS